MSTLLYVLVLAAVFVTWSRTEGTLSVHSIDTPRREAFYWAAVVATFAMGTALGDFTAYTLNLGYFASAAIFALIILVPAIGYRWFGWNAVFSFWFAYVVTRPLGASIADGLGKAKDVGGLGFGDGLVDPGPRARDRGDRRLPHGHGGRTSSRSCPSVLEPTDVPDVSPVRRRGSSSARRR